MNPFSAPACTFSGLKNTHIHACKQDLFSSYNKPTLNTVHYDGNSTFTCQYEKKKKKKEEEKEEEET